MNKKTLAALMFASLSTMMTAQAITIDPAAQSIIDAVPAGTDLNTALTEAINDPANAGLIESLFAAALATVNPDSPAAEEILATVMIAVGENSNLLTSIITIANQAGVSQETLLNSAIAANIDPTLIGEATSTGGTPGGTPGGNVGGSDSVVTGGGTGYTDS